MENLSLYIHIPFCIKKCNYCDFLSAPCKEETKQKYVDTLCLEISQRAEQFRSRKVDTIFFGGGTPSILTGKQSTKIMDILRREFQILPEAEISMELNPGTVNREKLETYQKLGINRLSIGLQSADNEELKILGRIHTWEVFLQTWNMVRDIGFTNVNIDLMSALPGQTLESYENTLRKILTLKPEHISAYSLIIEEGTKFYEWFGEEREYDNVIKKEMLMLSGEQAIRQTNREEDKNLERKNTEIRLKKLPDEITDRQMYELTRDLLEEHGYYRYEISNYALKGYECKHNIGYWKRKEYLGLGLGAASLIFGNRGKNIRSSNISDLMEYLKLGQSIRKTNIESEELGKERWKNIFEIEQNEGIDEITFDKANIEVKEEILEKIKWTAEQEELSQKEQMEEFMFLGLRMMEGVSPTEFKQQFGTSLQEVYGKQISKLERQGLLEFCEKTRRYALTLQGIDVSNQVFVEFID